MKISLQIKRVCEKLGIKYISCKEGEINNYKEDIQSLADVYVQLKDIELTLMDIETRRSGTLELDEFKNLIHQTIEHLVSIDHEIKKEAYKLLKIKKEHNGKT